MVHKKYSRRQILLAAGASLVVMAVLTFYLWHLTENVRLGYAIGRSENEKLKLEMDILNLKSVRESLASPGRVEKIARESLGLADLRDDQVVYEKAK
jgi:cell division protein FtsL